MLVNADDPAVQQKIEAECSTHGCLEHVMGVLHESPYALRIIAEDSALTVAANNEIDGKPNRGVFKIFFPKETKLVAIFYKKSLVSWSRDRYSYGGMEANVAKIDEAKIDEWLTFLNAGFDPGQRPAQFQRTFPYDLPDDE